MKFLDLLDFSVTFFLQYYKLYLNLLLKKAPKNISSKQINKH